jgi:hypothetical protein
VTRKKSLMDFVAAGRRTGSDLAKQRNPVEMAPLVTREEVQRMLAEAEEKMNGPLWEREFAATAIRSLDRAIDQDPSLALFRPRVDAIRTRTDALDDVEFAPLQEAIRSGKLGPEQFRAELQSRPPYQWDAFARRLLAVQHIPQRETERPAMMVHYLPSPLEAILEIAALLRPEDVFYDIGSGLGLVTMLTAWLSGAKAKGVEYEPAYHRRAVELANDLNMPRVEYICSDARAVDYSDGTVFYLYDTFRGPILDEMIEVLEKQAARGIRLVSRGKSTPIFEAVSWMERVAELPSSLTLFRSRPST